MSVLKSRIVKNASWIIACKIIQAILTLVVTMFTARYLGPSNYGTISYAASIVAFVVPVMQLGLKNTLVQEFVNDSANEGDILGSSLVLNMISAVCCMVAVTTFAVVANKNEIDTIIVSALYSTSLFFQALEMTEYWFQYRLMSKYVSLTMLFAYAVTSIYKIYLLVVGKSIYWFACAQSIDYIIIAVILLLIYRNKGGKRLRFSKATAIALFSRSRYYIVANLMVTIFAQTDKIMLKFMVGEVFTGYYAAAVTCANMSAFVFQAIIGSARPVIFENKNRNQLRFEQNMMALYSVIIYLSLVQCIAITCFSKLIIHILYGTAYYSAISPLKIIVWYTTFSYLGSVRNIWILAEGKQKVLWIINLSGALGNVALNAILIPNYGMNGAAVASLVTQFFTNVIMGYILPPIRPNNRLMIRALDVRLVLQYLKK